MKFDIDEFHRKNNRYIPVFVEIQKQRTLLHGDQNAFQGPYQGGSPVDNDIETVTC